jgi:hypothetical protein
VERLEVGLNDGEEPIEIDKALEQQYGVLSFEAWRERHSEMSGKGPTSDVYTI